ncbi:trichohyalin-like [Denticeps clupeoides]|uniref:trichohyalin-like n=1 Tax=Denticeps clupeoides TaxID=299321 RepID=UPI0010A4444E|nr:trichohyalin-like [Denticeps clupeoides]
MKMWKHFVHWISMTDPKSIQTGQVEEFKEQVHRLDGVIGEALERDLSHHKEMEKMLMASSEHLKMAIHDTQQNSLALCEELRQERDRQYAMEVSECDTRERLRGEKALEHKRCTELEAQLHMERRTREEAERRLCDVTEACRQMEAERERHWNLETEQIVYEEMLQREVEQQDQLRTEAMDEHRRREKAETELQAKREIRMEAERLLLEKETELHDQQKRKERFDQEIQQIKEELEMARAERDRARRGREELEQVLLKETASRKELEKHFQDMNNAIEETLKILLKREKELCGQVEETAGLKVQLKRLLETSQRDVEKRNQYKTISGQVYPGGWRTGAYADVVRHNIAAGAMWDLKSCL